MNFRIRDYVISFFIISIIPIISIMPVGEKIYITILKIIASSIILSLVIGTITNLIFKKK